MKTQDGYKLNMFRIMKEEEAKYGPMLILHGTGQSSIGWFLDRSNQENSALPVAMARAGYDVWLGNARGSKFSLGHETWSDQLDSEYWQFGFSEIGLYDLPAMIDHIYEQSDHHPVTFIGHSQATTAMFYGLSHLEPQVMANKLDKVLALAPCFIVDSRFDMLLTDDIWKYTLVDYWSRHIALDRTYQFNNGISVQTIKHYNQNAMTGKFQEYDTDFGLWPWERGDTPEVPIENITTPITYYLAG